ncbi:MAG: GNAT family N-acetyltransferase [Actinomycetes bacterium]
MVVQVVYETHATTLDNENGHATGWLPGELSEAGRRNAADLGRRRRDDGLAVVLTSDLARAAETVAIAFAGSDIPVLRDPRLREVDYGSLTGAPVDVVHARRRACVDAPFPGGQSYREVSDRVDDLLDELLLDRDGQRVLLVGHAATRFALDHLLTGRPLESAVTGPFAWREGWTYELTPDRPQLALLDGPATEAVSRELQSVYRAAFGAADYDEPEESIERFLAEQLPAHTSRAGFRCATVRLAGALAGFAYGYTGARGQWWSDRIAASAPPSVVDEWLGGHFEFVELAVDPRHQGRGFATALHDRLLLDLPHPRALLTTYRDERPAPRLYRRLGWQLLAPGVFRDSDLWGRTLVDDPRPS